MNTKRRAILVIIILFISLFSVNAGGQQEPVTSSVARTEPLLRVLSLAPNITEVIYALGKGDLLVGRTDYCNYPPEVSDVASVGSITQPSIEKIIDLNPDIVIASTHGPKEVAAMLVDAGIDVKYYYGPESFEGVYEVIALVGSDLGAEEEASVLTAEMKSRYEQLKERVSSTTSRPSVYYVIGFGEGGDWTAGGDTFIGQMIEAAGGENIAADISGWSYSLEKIVEADPDIILVGTGVKDIFMETPIYSELSAVKYNRVYGINEDIINRQGPRLIEGLEQLNAVFTK